MESEDENGAGQVVPAFELPDQDGNPVRVPEAIKGRAISMVFFLYWLRPLRRGSAAVAAVYRAVAEGRDRSCIGNDGLAGKNKGVLSQELPGFYCIIG